MVQDTHQIEVIETHRLDTLEDPPCSGTTSSGHMNTSGTSELSRISITIRLPDWGKKGAIYTCCKRPGCWFWAPRGRG